jgi:hypothetical protein
MIMNGGICVNDYSVIAAVKKTEGKKSFDKRGIIVNLGTKF